LSQIKGIAKTLKRARTGFVILGWGTCIASLATTAIFQAIAVPRGGPYSFGNSTIVLGTVLYYVSIFAVSFLAGFVLESLGKALIGFFASYTIGIILTFLVLYLPALGGLLFEPVAEITGITFTFTALFPFPLLSGLVGGLLGAAASEP
jgi:hypothetical protein